MTHANPALTSLSHFDALVRMKFNVPALALLFASTFLQRSAHALAPAEQALIDRAHRSETNGWIYLHVAGAAPERGFQHGYLLAREIAEEIRIRRVLWKQESSMEWPWLLEKASAMFEPKIDRENLDEIDGIVAGMRAAGVETTRAELIAYNGFFELNWYWWPKELKNIKEQTTPPQKQACSSFIATGSMTADGGIVLGHDTFFDYPEASANVIVDIDPRQGHRILMQTYPGW